MALSDSSVPASPCVRNCCLDDKDVCLGCGRHIDEIIGWHSATPLEKQEIIQRATDRHRSRKTLFRWISDTTESLLTSTPSDSSKSSL